MILKDGDRLLPTYIPSEIPHREKQVQQILQYYSNVLDNPDSAGLKFYQIIGPVGSGKTVATLKFGEAIEEGAKRRGMKLKVVYVNPRQHGSTRLMVFRRMVQAVEPNLFSASYSAEELLVELLKYLSKSNRYMMLIFDELDYFVSQSKEQIVYNLTRMNETLPDQQCRMLGVIFTARSNAYHSKLDDAELSSLGRYYVRFDSYNSQQVYDILERRSYEAIVPGAVNDKVLRYIADVTASPPVSGDIRYGLSLLYNSCMLAQNRGDSEVRLDHVRSVMGVISPSLTEEELMYLPEDEKFILYAISNGLKYSSSPYLSFDQIMTQVEQLRESRKGKKLDAKAIVKGVQDLADRGIIELRSLTEIGIPNIPANMLEKFLDFLMKRLENER
ncbi:MAG: AAA family ATPase [Conexivisphaerales archaeon]